MTKTPRPNGYGSMAQAHMAEHLPARYATINNPDQHFHRVGKEVLEEINQAMAAWERTQPQPIDPGTRNMTRHGIEATILAESVFLIDEPDPTEPQVDESGAWTGPTPGMGEWAPTWAGLTQDDWDDLDREATRAG